MITYLDNTVIKMLRHLFMRLISVAYDRKQI